MVFLKTLVCLSPWLLGHCRSETIAFSMGYLVVCCVWALALLTPLICSAVHRFATLACLLACLLRSLAPFTGSLTHFAHSLMGQLKFLNMCSRCKCVLQEQTRFWSSLETRKLGSLFCYLVAAAMNPIIAVIHAQKSDDPSPGAVPRKIVNAVMLVNPNVSYELSPTTE